MVVKMGLLVLYFTDSQIRTPSLFESSVSKLLVCGAVKSLRLLSECGGCSDPAGRYRNPLYGGFCFLG